MRGLGVIFCRARFALNITGSAHRRRYAAAGQAAISDASVWIGIRRSRIVSAARRSRSLHVGASWRVGGQYLAFIPKASLAEAAAAPTVRSSLMQSRSNRSAFLAIPAIASDLPAVYSTKGFPKSFLSYCSYATNRVPDTIVIKDDSGHSPLARVRSHGGRAGHLGRPP